MKITLFIPEILLSLMALFFFFNSLIKSNIVSLRRWANFFILTILISLLYTLPITFKHDLYLFWNAYHIDTFSQVFKILIVFGFFLIVYMGEGLSGIEKNLYPEYYLFLTFSVIGLVFLTSSVEILTIILCLEISSFALYIIIPFRLQNKYRQQMEAGIKYTLFGAAATGITLYGLSYVYGLTDTTYLNSLSKIVPKLIKNEPLLLISFTLILSSFFYKLAFFPMHFWAPDVYEGAANETTSFIATLPKIAAVALLIRFISLAGMNAYPLLWILATFSVLSMTIGNLSALVQNDIKRLLAYSSIAHAGYIMIGLFCLNEVGLISAIYYVLGYLIMNITCFYVVYNIAPNGDNVTFDNLKGLYYRSPLMAAALAVSVFGLAGIPPTIGFTGKLLIFTAAIQKGYYGLVIIAVINTGISAFYYLKMVRAAYTSLSNEERSVFTIINPKLGVRILGICLIILIILTGIFPQKIVSLAKQAVAVFV